MLEGGHGSAVTTANSVTCPPAVGATNSRLLRPLSTVRTLNDDLVTAGASEAEKVGTVLHQCVCACVCVCALTCHSDLQNP